MPFLKNVWYCAGWSHELDDGKFIRDRNEGTWTMNLIAFRRAGQKLLGAVVGEQVVNLTAAGAPDTLEPVA